MILAERNNRQAIAALLVVAFLTVFGFWSQVQTHYVVTHSLSLSEMAAIEGAGLDPVTKTLLVSAAVVGVTVGLMAITGGLAGAAAPMLCKAAWAFVGASYVNAGLSVASGVGAGLTAWAGW